MLGLLRKGGAVLEPPSLHAPSTTYIVLRENTGIESGVVKGMTISPVVVAKELQTPFS